MKNKALLLILLSFGLDWVGPIFAQVQQAWVASYDSRKWDLARALAVDNAGNVYVTGRSGYGEGSSAGVYATVKYDTRGNELWVKRYGSEASPSAMAVDGVGNVYVTGHITSTRSIQDQSGHKTYLKDIATVAYDASGQRRWLARYETGDWESFGGDIAVDATGNVYVAGAGSIKTTIKYDPSGNQLWTTAGGSQLALDSRGNVYITGYGSPFGTRKVDANGNQVWAGVNGGGNIKLDGAGNVYVLDSSLITKYDANGNVLWTAPDCCQRPEGPVLAVDSAGNAYANGPRKYDASGNLVWAASNRTFALTVDSSGSVYATGRGLSRPLETFKYDRHGQLVWSYDWSYPGSGIAIALDRSANVYVAGTSDYDYVTVKYVQTAAPHLASESMLPTTQFRFTLLGEPGRSYTIQASTNLLTWTAVTNFISVTGTNQFTDPTASSFNRRFYRATTP